MIVCRVLLTYKISENLNNTPGFINGPELTGKTYRSKSVTSAISRDSSVSGFSLKDSSPASKKNFNEALPHVKLALFFHKQGGHPIYSHEWTEVLQAIYRKVTKGEVLTKENMAGVWTVSLLSNSR